MEWVLAFGTLRPQIMTAPNTRRHSYDMACFTVLSICRWDLFDADQVFRNVHQFFCLCGGRDYGATSRFCGQNAGLAADGDGPAITTCAVTKICVVISEDRRDHPIVNCHCKIGQNQLRAGCIAQTARQRLDATGALSHGLPGAAAIADDFRSPCVADQRALVKAIRKRQQLSKLGHIVRRQRFP